MNLRISEPNIENMLDVFRRKPVKEVPLFELFMDWPVYEFFNGRKLETTDEMEALKFVIDGFYNAGFDYATTHASSFHFPKKPQEHGRKDTYSLDDANTITDWESFRAYQWPDPAEFDCSKLSKIREYLPEGMKLAIMGPGGVLENVIALVGYTNLCYMLLDEPELLQCIFDEVGSRLVKYYELAVDYDTVGFLISNDDWGFNTQTFMSVEDMRKYVFPWHKKIAEVAHRAGKFIALHSCGYMNDVMEDIIEDMKYDAKHSFEDNIVSVEDSYRRWGDRIAILGGLDLQFLHAATEDEVAERVKNLLKLTKEKGGYAVGTGNSMAYYIEREKLLAMIKARGV